MALTSQRRKGARKKKETEPADVSELLEKQLGITCGRMTFSNKEKRGILDRSFKSVKVLFHRDSSATVIREKLQRLFWPNSEGCSFYLADATGVSIESPHFEIEGADGSKSVVPWTLQNYLKMSSTRYASRTRLYIVKSPTSSRPSTPSSPTRPQVTAGSSNREESSSDTCSERMSADGEDGDERAEDVRKPFDPPVGYFRVDFIEKVLSKYSGKYSFRCGLSQEDILCYRLPEDPDTMFATRDSVAEAPQAQFRIFAEKPLELGFYIACIHDGDQTFELVQGYDCVTGDIHYKQPGKDDAFQVWGGCYSCPHDKRVLLACVALNGYHSCVTYSWYMNGVDMEENTPLLYTGNTGDYVCAIAGENVKSTVRFIVTRDAHESITAKQATQTPAKEEMGEEIHQEMAETPSPPMKEKMDIEETQQQHRKVLKDKERGLMIKSLQSSEECHQVQLLDVIGRGMYGQVHKALWRGTMVAAKVIPAPSVNQRMIDNELSVLRSCSHPNLLLMMGVIINSSSVIFVTNLVDGFSLDEWLFADRSEKLTYEDKVEVAVQTCQGVLYMHTQNPPLVHLDLKPANVLVEVGTKHVYIADFGLATTLGKRVLGTNTIRGCGTPGFQAPEQLIHGSVTEKCDVYALGGLIAELFGEQHLWPTLTPHQIMYKVTVEGIYPPTTHLSDEIQSITKLCLTKEENRATVSELLVLFLKLHV